MVESFDIPLVLEFYRFYYVCFYFYKINTQIFRI